MLKYVEFYRLFFSTNAPKHLCVNSISMANLLLLELTDWKNSATFPLMRLGTLLAIHSINFFVAMDC
jgi:hypothetical protein